MVKLNSICIYILGLLSGPARALDTVMMVIGGRMTNGSSLNTVELFGCSNGTVGTVPDYPLHLSLGSAVYLSDQEVVFVCGGNSCDQFGCAPTRECYSIRRGDDTWTSEPSLNEPISLSILVQGPNLFKPQDGPTLISIGANDAAEILDIESNVWIPYLETNPDWHECLVWYNDKVYALTDDVQELDLNDWSITALSSVPLKLTRAGKCVGLDLEGKPGLFTRYGYWYDLTAMAWMKKAFPQIEPLKYLTHTLIIFQGMPTFFGDYLCDEDINCSYDQVVQYDPQLDQWQVIGQMQSNRMSPTTAEVPASWCNPV